MNENDETWVRTYLIPILLKDGKLVDNYSEEKSFEITNISISYITSKEAFMLTLCYRLRINYQYDGSSHFRALIVKKTPVLPQDVYDAINFDSLFHNEITAYTEIIPALGFSDNYPKYFYSHRKKLEAVLVLGDFSIDGWSMTKARVNLSLEHILLSVKILGQFHGTGFALKDTDREKFNTFASTFRESRYATTPPHSWDLVLNICMNRVIKAAETIEGIPSDFLANLKKLTGNVQLYGKERVKPVEPIATICHGDFLRNNIAFKYNEKDIPIDVLVYDLQTFRYSSPMVDLTTLLSLSAGKDVRPKNFNEIFKAYYDELVTAYLKNTGKSLDNLPQHLSYDSLLKEYILYLPYSIGIAATFLHELHSPRDIEPSDMLIDERSDEELIDDTMTRGGKAVDDELAALVDELYHFTKQYNVNLFKEL